MGSEKLEEKAALKQAAKEFGLSKSEAYRELQRAKLSATDLTIAQALHNNSGQVGSGWAATTCLCLLAEIPRALSLQGHNGMARILCVDDEPGIVTLKCAILQAAGHEVTPQPRPRMPSRSSSRTPMTRSSPTGAWETRMAAPSCKPPRPTPPCRWWWYPDT